MLAGGPNEQSGEEIRQRRMIVPVRQQASEKIGAAQQRTIGGRCASNHDMVASARPHVPSVEHKLFGAQTCLPSLVIKNLRDLNQFLPA